MTTQHGAAASDEHALTLARFLKFHHRAGTGGMAKHLIREGLVQVNGEPETRPGRKLRSGDVVTMEGWRETVPAQGAA
ncbi:MAG: RNA-binding S4 domain-containing protein [Deltaproteobacteria bacterium]|nr:RNA-binding S4 domain-containing protein [Deltaproteobacteria bacterium]